MPRLLHRGGFLDLKGEESVVVASHPTGDGKSGSVWAVAAASAAATKRGAVLSSRGMATRVRAQGRSAAVEFTGNPRYVEHAGHGGSHRALPPHLNARFIASN